MKKIDIDVPDGVSGEWEVKAFEVSESDAKWTLLRASINCHREGGRGYVPAGTYKYLKRNGETIMSNTPDECSDFRHFVMQAKGKILVNGLGLGALLKALLNKQEITEVTVIEKSGDVIKLVAPTYLKDKRVTIIHADAFTWQPPKGVKYDSCWHDIWDTICCDNLPEMEKLHRKYARRTAYQDSWAKQECRSQR